MWPAQTGRTPLSSETDQEEGMERLAAVLEQLDLPEISRMLRRTVFAALGVGVVALVVLSLVGYPLAGLGACIGLAPRDREHPPRHVHRLAAERRRARPRSSVRWR